MLRISWIVREAIRVKKGSHGLPPEDRVTPFQRAIVQFADIKIAQYMVYYFSQSCRHLTDILDLSTVSVLEPVTSVRGPNMPGTHASAGMTSRDVFVRGFGSLTVRVSIVFGIKVRRNAAGERTFKSSQLTQRSQLAARSSCELRSNFERPYFAPSEWPCSICPLSISRVCHSFASPVRGLPQLCCHGKKGYPRQAHCYTAVGSPDPVFIMYTLSDSARYVLWPPMDNFGLRLCRILISPRFRHHCRIHFELMGNVCYLVVIFFDS